jgi:hypothetical protein
MLVAKSHFGSLLVEEHVSSDAFGLVGDWAHLRHEKRGRLVVLAVLDQVSLLPLLLATVAGLVLELAAVAALVVACGATTVCPLRFVARAVVVAPLVAVAAAATAT